MVMTLSTVAFTLLFNVWLMLGVLAPKLKESLGLSAAQVEWLIATAILSGALLRLNFGVWADRYGGRNVMIAALAADRRADLPVRPGDDLPAALGVYAVFRPGRERVHGGCRLECAFPSVGDGARPRGLWRGKRRGVGDQLLVGLFPAALAVGPPLVCSGVRSRAGGVPYRRFTRYCSW